MEWLCLRIFYYFKHHFLLIPTPRYLLGWCPPWNICLKPSPASAIIMNLPTLILWPQCILTWTSLMGASGCHWEHSSPLPQGCLQFPFKAKPLFSKMESKAPNLAGQSSRRDSIVLLKDRNMRNRCIVIYPLLFPAHLSSCLVAKHQTAFSYLSWQFMHTRKCVSSLENQEIFLGTWDNEFTFRRQVAKYLYRIRVWLILSHCENVWQCLSWREGHLRSRIDSAAQKILELDNSRDIL